VVGFGTFTVSSPSSNEASAVAEIQFWYAPSPSFTASRPLIFSQASTKFARFHLVLVEPKKRKKIPTRFPHLVEKPKAIRPFGAWLPGGSQADSNWRKLFPLLADQLSLSQG
jgi:hypothetical protein